MDYQAHWRGRERFVLFDSAFGDGAGFRRALAAWRADPARPAHLHFIALDEAALPGFRRVLQDDPHVTLDLLGAPLESALTQLAARIDALHLHRLEPAGVGFVGPLTRLLAQGAVLVGDALSAAQVAALEAAGFAPRQHGERIEAVFATRKPLAPAPPAPTRRAIVIGAGLAGAAACERLCARGWQVTLVERHAGAAMEASGNRAGIYMPLLSKDDNIPTRLSRAAFLFALDYWNKLGGIGGAIEGAACGVLQLARDAAHAEVQRRIDAAWQYPPAYARWLESAAAGALLGAPAAHGGWLFSQGGWARPASVCAAMLAACGARLTTRFGAGSVSLVRDGAEWRALDAAGSPIAQAPTVILANGAGAGRLAQAAGLPLAAVRGQVTHLPAAQLPALALVLCRDSYLTPASDGICSAGASYDLDDAAQLRASSQSDNLDKTRALLSDPRIGQGLPLQGRVGFRSVAPDRLPLVGALPDFAASHGVERLRAVPRQPGLHGLLGYASRGLIWAPLAAELLAARLEGEPLPIEAKLADALDPARFRLPGRRPGNAVPGNANEV